MDFTVLAEQKVKLMENEKLDTYQNLAKELKKLWIMVTVIPIIIGALETIPKILGNKLGN